MGICKSKDNVKEEDEESAVGPMVEYSLDATMGVYKLKKSRAGCTGMFWRPDPTRQTKKLKFRVDNANWPKDNALLEGQVLTLIKKATGSTNEKWLRVHRVKQVNDEEWIEAPEGAHLPFEYDNHYYLEHEEEEEVQ